MINKLKGFIKEEEGQGLTEYGLVLGLVAVAVVATLVSLRGEIVKLFQNALTTVQTGTSQMTSSSS